MKSATAVIFTEFFYFAVGPVSVTAITFLAKHSKPSRLGRKYVLNVLQAWISFSNFVRAESLSYLLIHGVIE